MDELSFQDFLSFWAAAKKEKKKKKEQNKNKQTTKTAYFATTKCFLADK